MNLFTFIKSVLSRFTLRWVNVLQLSSSPFVWLDRCFLICFLKWGCFSDYAYFQQQISSYGVVMSVPIWVFLAGHLVSLSSIHFLLLKTIWLLYVELAYNLQAFWEGDSIVFSSALHQQPCEKFPGLNQLVFLIKTTGRGKWITDYCATSGVKDVKEQNLTAWIWRSNWLY